MSVDDATPERLKSHFVGWQCRLRQMAMRKDGGRPSQGMRARAIQSGGEEISPGIIMLLLPKDTGESTYFFRHQTRRSHDPREVYDKVIEYLQGTHYQSARSFSDVMTASFSAGSETAAALLDKGECILEFAQFNQFYRMLCRLEDVATDDPLYDATYWHNRAFNPNLGDDVKVISFAPDWSSAQADPTP